MAVHTMITCDVPACPTSWHGHPNEALEVTRGGAFEAGWRETQQGHACPRHAAAIAERLAELATILEGEGE